MPSGRAGLPVLVPVPVPVPVCDTRSCSRWKLVRALLFCPVPRAWFQWVSVPRCPVLGATESGQAYGS